MTQSGGSAAGGIGTAFEPRRGAPRGRPKRAATRAAPTRTKAFSMTSRSPPDSSRPSFSPSRRITRAPRTIRRGRCASWCPMRRAGRATRERGSSPSRWRGSSAPRCSWRTAAARAAWWRPNPTCAIRRTATRSCSARSARSPSCRRARRSPTTSRRISSRSAASGSPPRCWSPIRSCRRSRCATSSPTRRPIPARSRSARPASARCRT